MKGDEKRRHNINKFWIEEGMKCKHIEDFGTGEKYSPARNEHKSARDRVEKQKIASVCLNRPKTTITHQRNHHQQNNTKYNMF